MCGILGFIADKRSGFDRKALPSFLGRLLHLSESRGKEASGIALSAGPQIDVLKRPYSAAALTRSRDFRVLLGRVLDAGSPGRPEPLIVLGHTRMVTHGSAGVHENNQPVCRDGMLCFHNGIVVNEAEIWQRFIREDRRFEVDTESILGLVGHFRRVRPSLPDAVQSAFAHLKGANSIALFAEDTNALILATSNGSIYTARSATGAEFIYASERYILAKALRHPAVAKRFEAGAIVQLKAQTGCVVTLDPLHVRTFDLKEEGGFSTRLPLCEPARATRDWKPFNRNRRPPLSPPPVRTPVRGGGAEGLVSIDEDAIAALRRCRRCLLPQTFPFIDFDDEGTCPYCRRQRTAARRGEAELLRRIRSSRRPGGEADCLVPLSGGRDSSYALHYAVKVLGLKPVAYTYDWGMVTDLARRNISRLCGELGVEHILVSADIRRKRRHIRKNVSAWLRKPDLGTVPLFMAGDKQFFYYAHLLGNQMKIGTTLFSMNPFERTDFKSGFCGIRGSSGKKMFWDLAGIDRLRLLLYYLRKFSANPAYWNASLLDTLWAYGSYYFLPKNFTLFYDYIDWDEKAIGDTLVEGYGWEKADDLKSTWRIGDGTAAFYNYIYYRVAGFTENDTFRSHQVRAGQLTRAEALEMVRDENRPRLNSIRWYGETVGFDWQAALRRINAIPPLYLPVRGAAKPEGPIPTTVRARHLSRESHE